MNVGILYFSGTNMTAELAKAIQNEFIQQGIKAELVNLLTHIQNDTTPTIDNYNGVIFGFPVYGGRAPNIVRDWLQKLRGNEKISAMFFTYGGVSMGSAHYSTQSILEEQGFRVIGSAEFLAKHSYNVAPGCNLVPNRPNEDDYQVARDFIRKLLDKMQQENPQQISFEAPPERRPKRKGNKKKTKKRRRSPFPFPSREEDCSMCLKCEEECPTRAFNAQTGEADPDNCIRCMRCVVICPDNVIFMGDMSDFSQKVRSWRGLTNEKLKQLKSKYFL
ncbi:MAG: hypothetical protein EU542_08005 [Promethearchaeota archaeon]|nr:MAG: hypothetical protein EU542_08005 [Candidatus Lokiarchaeota archaeon]